MWRFVAACARGTSHLKTSRPCQDRVACRILGNQTLVAAVADGAGSAALAELGADITVKTTVRFLSRQLDGGRSDYDEMLREAAVEARDEVLAAALRHGSQPRDFASTLLAVVVRPEGGSALQIGDGVIAVSDGGNGWEWAFWPQRVEYANHIPNPDWNKREFRWIFWPQRGEYVNTTHFLTDANAVECLRIVPRLGRVADIALMTDGAESLALHYASSSLHEPFFHGMFRPLADADEAEVNDGGEIKELSASLGHFLSSDRVRSRTDDDVSLILASWR